MIEVTTIKKAQLESRFLEHIKKGDYLSISIDTADGKIINYENTKKYKL
jgi:phosphoribosylformylglycinamidine (FGAM) synthase-like amidotransferase family enzyme